MASQQRRRLCLPAKSGGVGGICNSSEEHSKDKQEEVAVYKEPSMYDNLSKTLGLATESIADAYKRRLLADDLFLTKVGIEYGVGIFTKWHGLISHGVTLHFTNRHLKILRWHMYSSTVATMFTGFASTALFGHTLTINFILGISIVFISMHQLFSTLAKVKEEENGVLELKPVESNHRANEEGSHRVESDERRPLLPSLIDNGALRVKNNVLRFSGFAWQENDVMLYTVGPELQVVNKTEWPISLEVETSLTLTPNQ
ncbi:hypothetical protein L2E82_15569 [Cichorium intybus]|uniref:Uncharacterized protein n=1 Tax=Cichorium intybus TaxID=13427 RepID=A0ACB9F353_CICIN|nr:hypothetical protein L2E82_15569 [Cichorium intybus]